MSDGLDESTFPEGEKPKAFTADQFTVFSVLERMSFNETIDVFGHALKRLHGVQFVIEYRKGEEDTLDPVPVSADDAFDDTPTDFMQNFAVVEEQDG